MKDQVGFIGLGVMGRPMALNLLAAGHDLIVYNRSSEPREALVAGGARGAHGVADVARSCDVIITMLSDDNAVRQVMLEKGLLASARTGSLVIDMSTVSPALTRELAEIAAARGVRMLDAPVSGGDVGARDGTLSIMIGGAAEDVHRARPLFETLGNSVVHVGPSGAGQVVKACNQILVAITITGVSEALVLGSKSGVEPSKILDVLSRGLASKVMDVRRQNFLRHDFSPGFRVDLHHKDLAIALDAASELNVSLPATAIVQQMFQQLRATGCGDADHSALLTVIEAQSNHRTDSAPQDGAGY